MSTRSSRVFFSFWSIKPAMLSASMLGDYSTSVSLTPSCLPLKERTVNQRGGSEWEPIKILLEGDENSNKMNMASNTCLRPTTQVGQAHVATGVPLDLGTNTQPSDPRTQRNTKPRVH
jgi:hypothetical protein